MTTVDVFAPAKVNLTLHITGQTDAGYHLIDSLVTFASFGDSVRLASGEGLSLSVVGAETPGIPDGPENLVYRAAELLASGAGADMTLTKRVLSASGIGGGSADAAAAFRGMLAFAKKGVSIWNMPEQVYQTHARALLELGADVPMCLLSRPIRARGVGEKLQFLNLPPLSAVLVNPRVEVATPKIFGALDNKMNPPMPDELPSFTRSNDLISFLKTMRNDLEAPATHYAPEIATVLDAIAGTEACQLSRMSGSGGTCFGLYPSQADAGAAASALRAAHPDWWIVDCWLGDQMQKAMPQRVAST